MNTSSRILLSAKTDLDERLAELAQAFAGYPVPTSLEASPLSEASAILTSLRSSQLQTMNAEALGYYASAALTTVGSVGDYKHFMPRILYFATADASHPGFDPCLVASKLRLADWDSWPLPERTAVANFFYAAWAYERLQNTDFRVQSWGWIAAMAMLDLQFEACLELWTRLPTANAILQLAEGGAEIKGLQRGNGFWGSVSSRHRDCILLWMMSEKVATALVEGIETIRPSQRWQIERMLDDIEDLKRNVR